MIHALISSTNIPDIETIKEEQEEKDNIYEYRCLNTAPYVLILTERKSSLVSQYQIDAFKRNIFYDPCTEQNFKK